VRKNRTIFAHAVKTMPDHTWTAEDKRVDQSCSGGNFPQNQKEKKNKNSQETDEFLFSFLTAYILLLIV
jgi:hypothetical protein